MTPEMYPAPKKKNFALIKLLSFEALLLVALAVPVIGVLNYFRVITLPYLPQRPVIAEEVKKDIKAFEEQPVLYACPLNEIRCKSGKLLFDIQKRALDGIGYESLPEESRLLAVFDGTYSVQRAGGQDSDIVTVRITSKDKNFEAQYQFFGDTSLQSSGEIKQREVVGITNGISARIPAYSQQTYSFYFLVSDLGTKQILPLKPSDDGKALKF